MGDKYIYSATRRTPPAVGEVTVLADTVVSPAAVELIDPTADEQRAWFTFQAQGVDVGIIFGEEVADVATAPDLSAVAGDGRCMIIPAGTSQEFEIDSEHRHMRWVSTAGNGFIRYFRTSPISPLP